MRDAGIRHVRGPVRKPCFNGKVERFFRTIRGWMRGVLWPLGVDAMQVRLDDFREWYNTRRPHQALGGRTPDEAWTGFELPEPVSFYACADVPVIITMRREPCRGDPRLPTAEIRLAA